MNDDDPYLIEERGLWFDGNRQFLTIKSLVINHDFTMSMWIKPHGSGAIFSSSDEMEKTYKFNRSLHLSVQAYSFEWADNYHNDYQHFGSVSLYEWQHIALSAKWS
ncbi:MAG: hypothetical protein V2I33_20090 [Kangiellaceae bacterium]|nr:hypothetical protein [Kangiellaceae bacterium]